MPISLCSFVHFFELLSKQTSLCCVCFYCGDKVENRVRFFQNLQNLAAWVPFEPSHVQMWFQKPPFLQIWSLLPCCLPQEPPSLGGKVWDNSQQEEVASKSPVAREQLRSTLLIPLQQGRIITIIKKHQELRLFALQPPANNTLCKVRYVAMLTNCCLGTGNPRAVDGKTTWSEMRISSFFPIEAFFSHLKSSPQNRLKPKQHPFWKRTRWAPTSYKWSDKKNYIWPYKRVTGVMTL